MKPHRPLRDALDVLVRSPDTRAPAHGPHVRDVIDLKRTMAIVLLALLPCIVFAFSRYGVARLLPLFVVSYGVGLAVEWLFAALRKTDINEGYFVTGALIPLIVPITIPLWQLAVAVAFAVVFAKEVFGGTGYNIFNPALVCRAFLFFAYPAQMTGAVWEPPPSSIEVAVEVADDQHLAPDAAPHAADDDSADTVAAATPYAAEGDGPKEAGDAGPAEPRDAPAPRPTAAASEAAVDALSTASPVESLDAESGATPLALANAAAGRTQAVLEEAGYTTSAILWGDIPGSPGEGNKLAILFGALLLLLTGIASARVMVAGVVGLLLTAFLASTFTAQPTGLVALAPWQHLIMGGFLFGIVFMATDPVTHPETSLGKWVFGFLCGALTVLIRLYNPAYVEGTMLAILLMNAFAPAIDRGVLALLVRQRRQRRGA